ncbi:integrase core domain containing protein [Nitzschia inconspicua]|uniref:Integrase core domain containing protein n=1 Tax=Nitzschia inconspicua TaxID=303405 RepID=A0A9K3LF68_9STRA|nr:integrase core domain containing protein [Nitzschia inconspicua]
MQVRPTHPKSSPTSPSSTSSTATSTFIGATQLPPIESPTGTKCTTRPSTSGSATSAITMHVAAPDQTQNTVSDINLQAFVDGLIKPRPDDPPLEADTGDSVATNDNGARIVRHFHTHNNNQTYHIYVAGNLPPGVAAPEERPSGTQEGNDVLESTTDDTRAPMLERMARPRQSLDRSRRTSSAPARLKVRVHNKLPQHPELMDGGWKGMSPPHPLPLAVKPTYNIKTQLELRETTFPPSSPKCNVEIHPATTETRPATLAPGETSVSLHGRNLRTVPDEDAAANPHALLDVDVHDLDEPQQQPIIDRGDDDDDDDEPLQQPVVDYDDYDDDSDEEDYEDNEPLSTQEERLIQEKLFHKLFNQNMFNIDLGGYGLDGKPPTVPRASQQFTDEAHQQLLEICFAYQSKEREQWRECLKKYNTKIYDIVKNYKARVVENAAGTKVAKLFFQGRMAIPQREVFMAIRDCHVSRSRHTKQNATFAAVKDLYCNVTQKMVNMYIAMCLTCLKRAPIIKPLKGAACPIITSAFRDRYQVDLIDMRKESVHDVRGVHCNWILVLKDHYTKLSYCEPIPRKRPIFVAEVLCRIFGLIGPPKILQSDNGKEFTAKEVIDAIRELDEDIYAVFGRPRKPNDQGSVESRNKMVKSVLQDIQDQQRAKGKTTNWTKLMGHLMGCLNSHGPK